MWKESGFTLIWSHAVLYFFHNTFVWNFTLIMDFGTLDWSKQRRNQTMCFCCFCCAHFDVEMHKIHLAEINRLLCVLSLNIEILQNHWLLKGCIGVLHHIIFLVAASIASRGENRGHNVHCMDRIPFPNQVPPGPRISNSQLEKPWTSWLQLFRINWFN